jgi:hypothetical protein
MSIAATHKTIRTVFKEQITEGNDGDPEIATSFPNMKFTPPTDGSVWCQLTIKPVNNDQVTIGGANSRRFRYSGLVFVNVRCALNRGDKKVLEVVDRIKLTFRTQTTDGVVFRTPEVTSEMNVGKWYQVTIVCPFYAEET